MSVSRSALVLAALTLAACTPQSVTVREVSSYQTSVVVNSKATAGCVREARERAENEAASYCRAHGREFRPGVTDRQGSDETGCRVELVFSCALPRQ